ncbi:MAG: glycosyltransferase [Chloroflexota bacterium]|nr:glycosyltransferase [Chloroflexota bacterium]
MPTVRAAFKAGEDRDDSEPPLRRVAQLSVHTSPLATLGGKDAGGMNVYIAELACNLAKLDLAVDVITRRTDPETPEIQELCPGVNVIAISAGPAVPLDKNELFPHLPEFAVRMALFSLREGVRYDAMHAHYWLSGWAAHLVKRYWDTPFVQMFHTTAHQKNKVATVADRETDLRGQTERRLLSLADGLIAANPEERADLIWRFGTPTEKVCTIPPGVDLDHFRPLDQASSRAGLGLSPDDRVVLFVGRIDPIKGIDTLIEAVALMAGDPRHPDPTVLFVGGDLDDHGQPTGPLAGVVESVRRRGLAGCFRFIGSRPQTELPAIYSAADVVAVPSNYESFGLVAVEAMACGTPVVATRAGGLAFTVEDGVSGLLVAPRAPAELAEALTSLITDEPLRRSLAAGARPTAERFAWPAVASSVLHVYERLAAGYRANLCQEEEIYA